MKLNLLFAVFCLFSCAAVKPIDNKAPSIREPASSSNLDLPFSAPLPVALYQGPFNLNVDGSDRTPAKTYLPLQYDPAKQWPLVVMLHGFSGTADKEDLYLGLRFRTSSRGFVLLEPEGTVMPKGTLGADGQDLGGNQFWNATDACCDFGKTGVDDVTYIQELIKKVKGTYNIDSSRVYVFGHSNGGFMANRLGCEAGGSFAAIASLAGGTYKDIKDCRVPVAVPYLHIHAIDDKTILYKKAPGYAGGRETVAEWISKNGCENPPTFGPRRDFAFLIPGLDTSLLAWTKCKSGKEVELWTIHGFQGKGHNPHVPLFNLSFMDAVLDFLLRQQR